MSAAFGPSGTGCEGGPRASCGISSGRLRLLAMGKRQAGGHVACNPNKAARLESHRGRPIVGFSFRSSDRKIVKTAQARLEEALVSSRVAPPSKQAEPLEDGTFLRWTRENPTYLSGYAWFKRHLGDLNPNEKDGQTHVWKVMAHFGDSPEAARLVRPRVGPLSTERQHCLINFYSKQCWFPTQQIIIGRIGFFQK